MLFKKSDPQVDSIKSWLKTKGYKYEILHESSSHQAISFEYHNLTFVVSVAYDDNYLVIQLPAIYSVDGNKKTVLEICNHLTRQVKAAKIYIDQDDDVSCSVEMFIDKSVSVNSYFDRCLDVLTHIRKLFCLKIVIDD